MSHSVEDERLFKLQASEAYGELCNRAFPPTDFDAETNDFTHLASAESLSDDGYNVFLVESAREAKLILGFNDDPDSVTDTILALGEFQAVVSSAWQKFKAS
jgi:hypothetical protein